MSASTVFDVTRRHHFSERRMPLRQLPSERPFSELQTANLARSGRVLPLYGPFFSEIAPLG
jgi:hypothetical protein